MSHSSPTAWTASCTASPSRPIRIFCKSVALALLLLRAVAPLPTAARARTPRRRFVEPPTRTRCDRSVSARLSRLVRLHLVAGRHPHRDTAKAHDEAERALQRIAWPPRVVAFVVPPPPVAVFERADVAHVNTAPTPCPNNQLLPRDLDRQHLPARHHAAEDPPPPPAPAVSKPESERASKPRNKNTGRRPSSEIGS